MDRKTNINNISLGDLSSLKVVYLWITFRKTFKIRNKSYFKSGLCKHFISAICNLDFTLCQFVGVSLHLFKYNVVSAETSVCK